MKLTLHCSASVLNTSVDAEPSLRNSPSVSFSRHMSLMALAVFPVSFREWTNTRTYWRWIDAVGHPDLIQRDVDQCLPSIAPWVKCGTNTAEVKTIAVHTKNILTTFNAL